MTSQKLHYYLVDVFTDRPFGGNQLAVFPDGRGIDAETMQNIARELNLSETTFVLPPEHPQAQFKVRIFTAAEELPMAGHPTVGTGFVLRHLGMIPRTGNVVFEEGVGPILVLLSDDGRVTMTQPTPQFGEVFENRQAMAEMLSISVEQLAEGLPIQVVSSGVPFLYVPVRDLAAMRQLRMRLDLWEQQLKGRAASNLFMFTMEAELPGSTVHSRMFAPTLGIGEDPATGGASGPLGAYLVKYGLMKPVAGRCAIISEQGVEMGRPSKLYIDLETDGVTFTRVQVGGYTQLIGGGYLDIANAGDLRYQPNPHSPYRVKFDFRVDFTNGGHVQGEDFLLDIDGDNVADDTLKLLIVDAMRLARSGTVTLFKKQIVRRGEHGDARL